MGTRRWAVEGLAYLTFDADVKEECVEDEAALKALFQLSKVTPRVPADILRALCRSRTGRFLPRAFMTQARRG